MAAIPRFFGRTFGALAALFFFTARPVMRAQYTAQLRCADWESDSLAHTSPLVEPEFRGPHEKPDAWVAEFRLNASERRCSRARTWRAPRAPAIIRVDDRRSIACRRRRAGDRETRPRTQ